MATSREMTAGRALPLIFNFTMPLLMGNLLQQTYSLVDAAIVGKFLGINALASVGASTSVVFLILGFSFRQCPVGWVAAGDSGCNPVRQVTAGQRLR